MFEIKKPILDLDAYKADQTFLYMMLNRLKDDCGAYLNGINHLWAVDEKAHINEMLNIYEALKVKPTWISREEIINFSKLMGV